jgi:hypothetical protein
MKRILLVAVSSSALALAAPAIASAHHHAKHHHKHHGAKTRVLTFRASAAPTTSPASPTAPTTPTTESAGKVASFKEGVLTITLNDGTSVSGKVTEQTQIHCSAPPTTGGEDNDDEGGSGEGDHGSSGQPRASESSRHLARAADHGDGGDEGQQSCTTSALTEGALVREAELSISSAGAVWDHVDLIQ